MATVEYKAADYEIGPSSSKEFTFWWDSGDPISAYFDVSIAPVFSPNVTLQQLPLVEEQRAYLLETSEGPARTVLLLTLRNNNNFTAYFTANHVRIY